VNGFIYSVILIEILVSVARFVLCEQWLELYWYISRLVVSRCTRQ